MERKRKVSNEDFVRIWVASRSVGEVCERTGMSRSAAAVRASWLRKKGVKLKLFPTTKPRVNVAALNEIIAQAERKLAGKGR